MNKIKNNRKNDRCVLFMIMVKYSISQFVITSFVLSESKLERSVCAPFLISCLAHVSRASFATSVTVKYENTVRIRVDSLGPLTDHLYIFGREFGVDLFPDFFDIFKNHIF